MATELLAVGTSAANSPEFTLAAGDEATLALKGAADAIKKGRVRITLKADDGTFVFVDELNATPLALDRMGTYRLERLAVGAAVGAFRA